MQHTPQDAFTMQVDVFTMPVDVFTMQVDAFTMPVDAFTMQVDAFTMPVDELQKLTQLQWRNLTARRKRSHLQYSALQLMRDAIALFCSRSYTSVEFSG